MGDMQNDGLPDAGQKDRRGGRSRQLMQAVDRMGTKPFIILLLVFLFLLPINMIDSLVRDRGRYRDEAVRSVLQPKGGQPVLEGILMAVPYNHTVSQQYTDSGGLVQTRQLVVTRYLFSVPEVMEFSARVEPEYLTRGIFDVPVFTCRSEFVGSFAPASYRHLKIQEEDIRWDEALLLFGVSNKKSLAALPVVEAAGLDLVRSPAEQFAAGREGTAWPEDGDLPASETRADAARDSAPVLERSPTEPVRSSFRNTLYYNLPAELARNGFGYRIDARVQGGESLSIVPLAADNRFSVSSDWSTPGFGGGWLPTERSLGADGFSAYWSIPGLSTVYPATWTAGEGDGDMGDRAEAVEVSFVIPVDNYQKTSRSVKYAVLFLIIPFLAIFIFEIFTRVRIHPIQYCLIGLVDVIFYLLLLSVSEHLEFGLTYWISSAAVSLLGLFYAAAIFRRLKWGLLFAAVQFVSYVFLFGTLQAEDYALLIGTLGLFFVVVLLMALTRRIDWYAVSADSAGTVEKVMFGEE